MAEATISAAQVRKRRDPSFPGYDTYLDDRMQAVLPGCLKRGTKFNDLDGDGQPREAGEPGLPGWKIRAYTFPANVFAGDATTGAGGSYELSLACGTYTFCEAQQSRWTETFPAGVGGDVVSCVGIELNPSITLGPLGYRETLVAGQPSEGNDFGNHTVPPPVVVRGKTQGFWCCPMPGCDGIGFGFDIFPVDPEYRDERGWFADDDESVNDLIHPDEDEPSENKLPIDEKQVEDGNEDVPF